MNNSETNQETAAQKKVEEIEQVNLQSMIKFAEDAAIYHRIRLSATSKEEEVFSAYNLQERMKKAYPKEVCKAFFDGVGGEIKLILPLF